jgi:hypothetical protein
MFMFAEHSRPFAQFGLVACVSSTGQPFPAASRNFAAKFRRIRKGSPVSHREVHLLKYPALIFLHFDLAPQGVQDACSERGTCWLNTKPADWLQPLARCCSLPATASIRSALPISRRRTELVCGEWERSSMGDSPEANSWIQARYDELDAGRLKCLVQALHRPAYQHKEARDCIRYIWNNRRRMRYPKFRKQGFCTSAGVAEAGCKVVIGTRLKGGHALDRKGRKRHHRPPLQQAQRTLRGFLGTPLRSK